MNTPFDENKILTVFQDAFKSNEILVNSLKEIGKGIIFNHISSLLKKDIRVQ